MSESNHWADWNTMTEEPAVPKTRHVCRASVGAVLLLGLWVTSPAADDASDCRSPEPETRIRACTNLLDAGRLNDDNRAAVHVLRGIGYAGTGNHHQAIGDFDQAIAAFPDRADTYYLRGVSHAATGNPEAAIADFDTAISIDPNHADALTHRGRALMANGEPRRAIDDLDAALAIVPDHPGLLYHRGVANADAGELDAALADYDRVVEIQPDHPEVYYNRGLAYDRKGRTARAIDDFDSMIEINPDHAGAIHHRSLARRRMRVMADYFRERILAEDSGLDTSCFRDPTDQRLDRPAVTQLFPPALESWSASEVQVTELEPAMRELDELLDTFGGMASASVEKKNPRVRLRAVRNYSNGDKVIKVTIDTEDLETLGIIIAAHEKDDVSAKLAADGFQTETARGHQALIALSEPRLAAIRVGENGLVSLECNSADCDADLRGLIDRIDFDGLGKFVACDHRAGAAAIAE